MANTTFQIFKVLDRELISSLLKISRECNAPNNATFTLYLGEKHNKPISVQIDQVEKDENIQAIISAGSSIFWRVRLTLPNIRGTSITVSRQEGSDQARVDFPDDANPQDIAPLIASSRKHLKAYERTESIDKLLGDELAEFYRRREQGLLRLEELSDKLIHQNEKYRKRLDEETEDFKKKSQEQYEVEKNRLQEEYKKKEKDLETRELKLDERTRDLDDRDSRHARRQIRMDLKNVLAERNKEFTLTEKTSSKRIPIHILFILLISCAGIFFISSLIGFLKPPSNIDSWYLMLRLTLSAVALAAAIVFYIRWNDQWFHQHADEEFRLKRLELDIDRASWVVEMALEWKDEKGTEIPEELIACLSRNLFVDKEGGELVKHPSEDLASALLGASSGLKIRIPGLGEATFDRKGVDRFKKAATKSSD